MSLSIKYYKDIRPLNIKGTVNYKTDLPNENNVYNDAYTVKYSTVISVVPTNISWWWNGTEWISAGLFPLDPTTFIIKPCTYEFKDFSNLQIYEESSINFNELSIATLTVDINQPELANGEYDTSVDIDDIGSNEAFIVMYNTVRVATFFVDSNEKLSESSVRITASDPTKYLDYSQKTFDIGYFPLKDTQSYADIMNSISNKFFSMSKIKWSQFNGWLPYGDTARDNLNQIITSGNLFDGEPKMCDFGALKRTVFCTDGKTEIAPNSDIEYCIDSNGILGDATYKKHSPVKTVTINYADYIANDTKAGDSTSLSSGVYLGNSSNPTTFVLDKPISQIAVGSRISVVNQNSNVVTAYGGINKDKTDSSDIEAYYRREFSISSSYTNDDTDNNDELSYDDMKCCGTYYLFETEKTRTVIENQCKTFRFYQNYQGTITATIIYSSETEDLLLEKYSKYDKYYAMKLGDIINIQTPFNGIRKAKIVEITWYFYQHSIIADITALDYGVGYFTDIDKKSCKYCGSTGLQCGGIL